MNDDRYYPEDPVLGAIHNSTRAFFSLSQLLCVFQDSEYEIDIRDFLSYLTANGYTELVGQGLNVLTRKGKESGFFMKRPGDHRLYLNGHGFLHFAGEIVNGKIWARES